MSQAPPSRFVAVVLAAGLGTRMKSGRSKVFHPVLGVPMLAHVLRAAREAGCERAVVVVSPEGESELTGLGDAVAGLRIQAVVQDPPRGTGDAVRCALPVLEDGGGVLILNGDLPCLRAEALRRMMAALPERGLALAVAEVEEPAGYGRIVRDTGGSVVSIREEQDCSPAERSLTEVNLGVYAVGRDLLADLLSSLSTSNAQGELYLTDGVAFAAGLGRPVEAVSYDDPADLLGVNDRLQLAAAEGRLRRRVLDLLMRGGVTVLDPDRTVVEAGVQIGRDCVIEPGVALRGRTRIAEGCRLGQGSILTDAELGPGVRVEPYCVVDEARLERGARIGPFARLRPGTVVREGAFAGNFVELKKTDLGPGSKAGHLSYLGDASIGRGVNVGAGTITCNYDGAHKHPTVLEDGVFIGSDTQLVAPVRVGKGAYVGAGTTVTHDVPPGALALSRVPQTDREGWVARREASRRAAATTGSHEEEEG